MSEPSSGCRDLVTSWLAAKRQHVVDAVDGVDDEDARRPVVPSGWSLLHVVHHLALDVERYWVQRVVAGRDVALAEGGAWRLAPPPTVAEALALYREEARVGDEVVAALPWDAPVADRDGGPWSRLDQVVAHVLVDTTTHAGHLDIARELLDGHQRLVVDAGPTR